jgi:hypothetical protein
MHTAKNGKHCGVKNRLSRNRGTRTKEGVLMKHIRIFGVIFVALLLSLPLDALGCDELEAALESAQQTLTEVNRELKKLSSQGFGAALGALQSLSQPLSDLNETPPSNDPADSGSGAALQQRPDPLQTNIGSMIKPVLTNYIQSQINFEQTPRS